MNKNDIFQIKIEDISEEGMGIGHVDGMAVFVKDTVTGDLFPIELQEGDVLLLCTDGLHGEMIPGQMEQLMAEHEDMQELCDALVDAANTIFSDSFEETVHGYTKDYVPKEQVELRAKREDLPAGQDVLYHVTVSGDNKTARADALATFVCRMSEDPHFTAAGYTLSDVAGFLYFWMSAGFRRISTCSQVMRSEAL